MCLRRQEQGPPASVSLMEILMEIVYPPGMREPGPKLLTLGYVDPTRMWSCAREEEDRTNTAGVSGAPILT